MSTVTTTETSEPNVTTAPAAVVTVVPPQPALPQVVSISKSNLDSVERRKDWALWIITGGGMAMTLYAVWALYLIQHDARHVYYLGIAAMINIFVLFGAIAGLLVRRTVNISKNGLIMEDHDNNDKQS